MITKLMWKHFKLEFVESNLLTYYCKKFKYRISVKICTYTHTHETKGITYNTCYLLDYIFNYFI